MDLQDALRGTWFGINEQGKIGVLLAITQRTSQRRADAIPKGRIVHGFLKSDKTGAEYCDSLIPTATDHNGYTFVVIDRPNGEYEMHSFTNFFVDEFKRTDWEKGVQVVGNSPPHKPYKKVERGRKLMAETLEGFKDDATPEEALFTMGQDREVCFPDDQLVSQGRNAAQIERLLHVDEYEHRDLAKIFTRIGSPPWYGTRSQTALVVDKDGSAFVRERRLVSIGEDEKEEWETRDFTFQIPPRT